MAWPRQCGARISLQQEASPSASRPARSGSTRSTASRPTSHSAATNSRASASKTRWTASANIRTPKRLSPVRRFESRSAMRGILCVAGMGVGLLVDMWCSPTKSIPAMCISDGSLVGRLGLHLTLMPAAHGGMLLAGLICALARSRGEPLRAGLLLGWQFLSMGLAAVGSLLLVTPTSHPLLAMAGMAILMSFANLSIVERAVVSAGSMKALFRYGRAGGDRRLTQELDHFRNGPSIRNITCTEIIASNV